MGLKDLCMGLSKKVDPAKFVFPWDGIKTHISNVVTTPDGRIDIHQDRSNPGWAVAKIQVNKGAKDPGAKEFLRKGNKGTGHKTTHKNLAEISFSQTNFDEAKFRREVTDAWKWKPSRVAAADDDNGEGSSSQGWAGSGSGSGGSSSSEWVWWSEEGIYSRQMNGIYEWSAPQSDADSDWIYSIRMRKYFIRYANGTVVWQ